MTDKAEVARYYDAEVEDEYRRLTKAPLQQAELELTLDLLEAYVEPGSSVLDVGAGPGRYSEWLLDRKGCRVGLVDLSLACLDEFVRRAGSAFRDRILFAEQGCATDLRGIDAEAFDCVLLMGPLYHLLEESERESAIGECCRVLRPGGIVFASCLSPYAKLARLLVHEDRLDDPGFVASLLDRRVVRTSVRDHRVDWSLCWPSEARAAMETAGFETMRLRNLEGLGSLLGAQQAATLADDERKRKWFGVLRATCENPDLLGATIHFLYVGRKRDA